MRIGSLFSGIGGLDLGLEWAGVGHTVWQVERDPWARSILAKHWPDIPRYDDVRTVTRDTAPPIEVLCGGFPCQDLSFAGKGAGINSARSGLFFELMRIADEMGPRFIVLENVAAILTRGMDVVLGRLAESGYDAWWDCIPASACGAPHRRDRWFLVGYAGSGRAKGGNIRGGLLSGGCGAGITSACIATSDASTMARWSTDGVACKPRMGRTSDGLPPGLDRYPKGVGPTQHPWEPARVHEEAPDDAERLRGLGNAVVPQVGWIIGRALLNLATEITDA